LRLLLCLLPLWGWPIGSIWNGIAHAAEEEATTESEAEAPSRVVETSDNEYRIKTKGRRLGEKETEGTQAPHRLPETKAITSQYKLNGEPLEVDPD